MDGGNPRQDDVKWPQRYRDFLASVAFCRGKSYLYKSVVQWRLGNAEISRQVVSAMETQRKEQPMCLITEEVTLEFGLEEQ